MSSSAPFNVSAELAALSRERKHENQGLHRLPPNARIQRRPINHDPIANIHTGAKVPKVVYVSRHTPVMAAVKRVKKMLQQIEKRALQDAGATLKAKDQTRRLKQANERLKRDKEEVLVKASGRAMERALNVGDWFKNREKEYLCNVEVRAGNVSVIDDIVEGEETQAASDDEVQGTAQEDSKVECGDTTLEMLQNVPKSSRIQSDGGEGAPTTLEKAEGGPETVESTHGKKTRRRKKRKRPIYEQGDLPEARIRWVKTVEVAISLQG